MLRVRLLGAVDASTDGGPLELPSGRPFELFAWLAAHPGRQARNRAAPEFWPDVDDSTARASLRTALWALRRALGDVGAGVLHVDRDAIELGGDGLWVDLRTLSDLAAEGDVDGALAMDVGELLPGIVTEWADELREGHRRRMGRLLTSAAAGAEDAGNYVLAADYARRRAAIDPFSEEPHREVLRLLAASGDAAEAARDHAAFRRRLWEELRVVPTAETIKAANACLAASPLRAGDDRRLPPRLASAQQEPFVGRVEELRVLHEAWHRRCATSRPQVIVLAGEPGIGKTRLAARFAADAHAAGAVVLFGAADEEAFVPGAPFLEAHDLPLGLDPQEAFDAVTQRMVALAAASSIVLVLDDFHWADALTVALFRHVVRARYAPQVTVVMTYRHTEDPAAKVATVTAEVAHDCDVTRVQIEGLSPGGTADLLDQLVEAPIELDARRVHERTGGNPFFTKEVAGYLARGGSARAIPGSVRDVVTSRVQRISTNAADVLAAASVLGMEARVTVIEALAGDLADPLGAVDKLISSGLLTERRAGVVAFPHTLVRDTVYEGMSQTRRAWLHRGAADALGAAHGGEEGLHLCDIAVHRCRAVPAVPAAEAVRDARRAGDWAIEHQAYDQAVIVLTRALAVAGETERPALNIRRAVAYQRLTHAFIDPANPS